jgi:hypothetical protein
MDNKKEKTPNELIIEKYMRENPILLVLIDLKLKKPTNLELKFENFNTTIDPEIEKKLERLRALK